MLLSLAFLTAIRLISVKINIKHISSCGGEFQVPFKVIKSTFKYNLSLMPSINYFYHLFVCFLHTFIVVINAHMQIVFFILVKSLLNQILTKPCSDERSLRSWYASLKHVHWANSLHIYYLGITGSDQLVQGRKVWCVHKLSLGKASPLI